MPARRRNQSVELVGEMQLQRGCRSKLAVAGMLIGDREQSATRPSRIANWHRLAPGDASCRGLDAAR